MKKIIFLVAISFSLFTIQCDNKKKDEISSGDVPASVQASFNEKYAGATDIKWENALENKEKTYKANFRWNGKDMVAEFDGSGVFIKENEK